MHETGSGTVKKDHCVLHIYLFILNSYSFSCILFKDLLTLAYQNGPYNGKNIFYFVSLIRTIGLWRSHQWFLACHANQWALACQTIELLNDQRHFDVFLLNYANLNLTYWYFRLEEYNAAGQIGKREKNISDERSNELAINSSENITELVTYSLFNASCMYVACQFLNIGISVLDVNVYETSFTYLKR